MYTWKRAGQVLLLLLLLDGYLLTVNELLSFHKRLHVMDDKRLEDGEGRRDERETMKMTMRT